MEGFMMEKHTYIHFENKDLDHQKISKMQYTMKE
jgi:hypothetical protein